MANQNVYMGANYAPAYEISGIPFVTGSVMVAESTVELNFPSVTRSITVKNDTASTTLCIAFSENGLKAANNNFFTLDGGESYTDELRCKTLFLSCSSGTPSWEVIAGLTGISRTQFPILSASNDFLGIG